MRSDDCLEKAVMASLCESLDTARSLSVYLLLKYASDLEVVTYLKKGLDPGEYCSAEVFEADYLALKFLSKWEGWMTGANLENEAIARWLMCEDLNGQTNSRLKVGVSGNPSVDAVMLTAQRKIASILGRVPSLRQWSDNCSWSGGSTFDLKFGSTALQKLTSKLTVTNEALLCMSHVIGGDLLWVEALTGVKPDGPCCLTLDHFNVVVGEKFSTVPKDATTRRTIAKQPTANIYLQKGVGLSIRRALRQVGVLLNDQTWNQCLAAVAYDYGLATLDLEDASNSLTRELVFDLLPIDWAVLLETLRCKVIVFEKGKTLSLNMHAAMGNGYTFELESLIFYGLAYATCEVLGLSNVFTSVYGDDIIVPQAAAEELTKVLAYAGFRLNPRKSYLSGPFYESCGEHYFCGSAVTPVFQKVTTSGKREELIRFHNRLYRWSKRTGRDLSRCLSIIIRAYKALGDKDVPRIPDFGSDDSGFLCNPNDIGVRDRNRGYRCRVYRPCKAYIQGNPEIAFYALVLRSGPKSTLTRPTHLEYSYEEPHREVSVAPDEMFPPNLNTRLAYVDPQNGLSADREGYGMLMDPNASYDYTWAWYNQ